MKNQVITFFLFLIWQTSFSQVEYKWAEISSLTIYKTKTPYQYGDTVTIDNRDTIELKAKCDLSLWKNSLQSLPDGPNLDVAIELSYIFVCEFKNGETVPFEYYPKQHALFDLRKNHFNYELFPKEYIETVDKAFDSCLICVLDVNCQSEK